jgi:hypothetical protein
MSSGCKTKPAAADHARRARKATTAFPQKLNEEHRHLAGLASIAGPNDHDRVHVHSPRGPPIKRFLTKREVMERVGFSYPAIWGWMRENKFPRGLDGRGALALVGA